METHSLTAILAGSTPDFACTVSNNPRIDAASIDHAELTEADRAFGPADRGSIRRLDFAFTAIEQSGTILDQNGEFIDLSHGSPCTVPGLAPTVVAGSTRLPRMAAFRRTSLSPP